MWNRAGPECRRDAAAARTDVHNSRIEVGGNNRHTPQRTGLHRRCPPYSHKKAHSPIATEAGVRPTRRCTGCADLPAGSPSTERPPDPFRRCHREPTRSVPVQDSENRNNAGAQKSLTDRWGWVRSNCHYRRSSRSSLTASPTLLPKGYSD